MTPSIFRSVFLFFLSFTIFLSTAFSQELTKQELTQRKGRELFLTQKLKNLEYEYTEWQFKRVVLQRYALKTGVSMAVEIFASPDSPVRYLIDTGVFATAFYFTFKALTAEAGECGCILVPLAGSTVVGFISAAGFDWVLTLLRSWYKKSYTGYYNRLTKMSTPELEEEWLNIEGALADLGQKILKTRQELSGLKMGADLKIQAPATN